MHTGVVRRARGRGGERERKRGREMGVEREGELEKERERERPIIHFTVQTSMGPVGGKWTQLPYLTFFSIIYYYLFIIIYNIYLLIISSLVCRPPCITSPHKFVLC